MMLSELELVNFFPGSTITTRFGWDKDPPGPRIHHAVDRAGPGDVRLPFDAEKVEWIDADGQGNSVIRAFADGGALELRMLHFIRAEIDPDFLHAALAGHAVKEGAKIGPTGNKGLSVATVPGGTGRHVHYSLLLRPGIYDDELDALSPGWRVDLRDQLAHEHGPAFIRECTARGVIWINPEAMQKQDPWTGKARIIIDTARILNF
jgi:hypothetical protein